MCKFQGEEEKAEQQQQTNYMVSYQIPDSSILSEKYMIKYPIVYESETDKRILNIILEGIDKWNNGIEYYINWLNGAYANNAISYDSSNSPRTMENYINEMREFTSNYIIKKIYFDHILIRDYWAGIHYRYTKQEIDSEVKDTGDRMQFLQFESTNLKIINSWIK